MVQQNTTGNALSAGSLAMVMASSLLKDQTPQLKSGFDAIALAVHAGMIAVGFRLVGLGEEHRIDAQSEAHEPLPLPKEWNESNQSSYAFRYKHSQSSMEYLVKVNRLGGKVVVFAMGMGDDRTTQFEVVASEYIADHVSWPQNPVEGDTSVQDASDNVQRMFHSKRRLSDIGSLMQIKIIQKLAPGIHKEGYEETVTAESGSTQSQSQRRSPPRGPERPQYDPLRDPPQPEPARPHPLGIDDPLRAGPPRRPVPDFAPPGFEDEYEMNRPPRGMEQPGRNPLNIGEQDLYPPGMGPNDPIRPHFGPGGGFGGGRAGGGGMHPTFDDPLFAGQGGGVGGYDPQVPPGARYDPVRPGEAPRDRGMGGRFPGGGGFGDGMGGRPPNPFGGFGDGDFI